MDDGLVHLLMGATIDVETCLNPCCSGRWSRTGLSKVNAKSLEKS